MTRLFLSEDLSQNKEITLNEENAHYIGRVLRMAPGDTLIAVDLHKNESCCEVVSIGKKDAVIRCGEVEVNNTEPPVDIVLYQSISKGERMDLTIQKSVELGVGAIVPVLSERCVARCDMKDSDGKIDRWQKIALEAARQSGRGKVPQIMPVRKFEDAIKDAVADNDLCIIPWEEEKAQSLKDVFNNKTTLSDVKSIAIFIGPEGGYSEEEAKLASASGIGSVTLGKRILRTETAGPAVLAMIIYASEL